MHDTELPDSYWPAAMVMENEASNKTRGLSYHVEWRLLLDESPRGHIYGSTSIAFLDNTHHEFTTINQPTYLYSLYTCTCIDSFDLQIAPINLLFPELKPSS